MVSSAWDITSFIHDRLFDIADLMLSNPIYLLGFGILVTGAVIGLAHRLIRG